MASTANRRVALAFFAHPDDAEFLCAGTLARLAASRAWDIHIASATAGDCGTATLSAVEIARVRKDEADRSAQLNGATYHCLEELDAYVV
jgi:LmbE family N-acetylglucosaminyl deacetylase